MAKAAEDVKMAGMNPAATVDTVFITSGWDEAERAVFTTLAVYFFLREFTTCSEKII